MGQRPCRVEIMVVRDFNAYIVEPEGKTLDNFIAAELADAGLEYMSSHFLPSCIPWSWDGCNRRILRKFREVQFWADYIIGKYHRLFWNIYIRYPRYNMDHYMFLWCLHGAS